MIRHVAVLALACVTSGMQVGGAMAQHLALETPRPVDGAYQGSLLEYDQNLTHRRQLLAVRAPTNMKRLLLSTEVLIVNRGRAEAITVLAGLR